MNWTIFGVNLIAMNSTTRLLLGKLLTEDR